MSLNLEPVIDILFLYMMVLTELGSSDPEGDLFYHDLKDLDGPVDYRFWTNTGTTDDKAAVVAQFYKKGQSTFIAEVC